MLTKEELPACPVATTVQLIGSKWKLLILRNLLQRPWRFNELRRDLEGISQKVLTDSLRAMEEDGIITRTVYPEVPPRVEYALSPLGESMRPILDAMEQWGTEYKRSCPPEKAAARTPVGAPGQLLLSVRVFLHGTAVCRARRYSISCKSSTPTTPGRPSTAAAKPVNRLSGSATPV